MISKKDILKMVRHVKRRSDGLPDRALMHPVREWCIGLACFVLLGIAGGLYSAKMYMYYLAVDQDVVGEAVVVEEYRQSNADEALKIFGNKKITFQQLVSGLPVVATDVEIDIGADEGESATTTDELPEEISEGKQLEEGGEETSEEETTEDTEEAPQPGVLIVD